MLPKPCGPYALFVCILSEFCVRKANGIAFALMLVEHPNAQRIRLLSDNKSGA